MAKKNGRQARRQDLRFGSIERSHPFTREPTPSNRANSNYSADAGNGSRNFCASETWRAALLGTVAAGALFFGYGRSARAACSGPPPADTLTCTGIIIGDAAPGVVNGGILVPGSYTTLNVNNLDDDITPETDVDGINFTGTGPVNITSDTSPYIIETTGDAIGINAYSPGDTVSVQHTGDIRGTGGAGDGVIGIRASSIGTASAGAVTVTGTGNVSESTGADGGVGGILVDNYASAGSAGAVTINWTGDISASAFGDGDHDARGIVAVSISYGDSGAVTITNSGNVTAETTRVGANGFFNSAIGIIAQSEALSPSSDGNAGAVAVTSQGDIVAKANSEGAPSSAGSQAYGIAAIQRSPAGTIDGTTLVSHGDISATATSDSGALARGVAARTAVGYADGATLAISSEGNVTAAATVDDGPPGSVADARGFIVESMAYGSAKSSDITITTTGDVTASASGGTENTARGFYASATADDGDAGAVSITSTGDVTIEANGPSGNVARTMDARSYSQGGDAGTITIVQTGDVTATAMGGDEFNAASAISFNTYSYNYSSGPVSITNNGEIAVVAAGEGNANVSGIGGESRSFEGDAAPITITNTGNITLEANQFGEDGFAAGGTAIFAFAIADVGVDANAGAVTIIHDGDITATAHSEGNPYGGSAFLTGIFGGSEAQDGTADATSVTSTGDFSFAATSDSSAQVTGINAGNHASGGDGEGTTVHHTGDIIATAIGGGAVPYGVTSASGVRTSSSASGTAGDVEVVTDGDIKVTSQGANYQNRAYGIRASSSSSDTAGNVSITANGDVRATASGNNAYAVGIHARSAGDLNNGNIEIDIQSGTVVGDTAGVLIEDGDQNSVTNWGTITSPNVAIMSGVGNEIIDNYGTVTGNVELGGSGNSFHNMTGGLFNSGATANVGGGNLLTNNGTLSPFGLGTVGTTILTGNLLQNGSGIFAVDLDGASSDFVDVSSDADLAGTVEVNLISFPTLTDYLILDSSFTIDNNLSVTDSLAVDYDLVFAPDDEVHLTITGVNFAVSGLNQNQTNIAENLNDAFDAGGGDLGGVLTGLANLTSEAEFANALDQLSPEIYADTQLAALYSSLDFSNNLLSCRINGRDTAAINKQGQCVWAAAKWRDTDRDSSRQYIGFDEQAWQFSGGVQVALDPVWRLNFGLGYQNTSLDTDTGASSDGDLLQGGVALKYNPGALLLAGIVSGGRGWYDATRPIAFDGFAATANSSYDIDVFQGRLHASYVMGAPSFFFKPMLDAAATYVGLDDANESYASGAGLNVHGNDETIYSLAPAIEVGTEWWTTAGTLIRPFVRGGVTWFSEDDVMVSASFAGAPDGVGPFSVRAQTDDVLYDLSAGLEMITAGEANFRVFYDGHFGNDTTIHSVGLKGSAKF